MNNSKGLLIILSGPSGAGKDTVLKELLAHNDKVRVSISATTRQPRQGEENGRDYHFISREQFETLIQRDGVLEYAEYCGNFYGTPRAQVEAWLDEGLDVVLEIEVQGAKKVMAKCPEAVSVFILPPSFAVLEKRLRRRATDSEEAVQKRLAAARGEILQAADYDYMVVNDALEDCVSDLEAGLQGEKCRSARAGNLIEEVLKNE